MDNLLSAGICLAEHIIVVKEVSSAVEEHLADCTTIITAQKIHRFVRKRLAKKEIGCRMFPKLKLITELTYSSNMRFMQFDPYDSYALQQSKFEKVKTLDSYSAEGALLLETVRGESYVVDTGTLSV